MPAHTPSALPTTDPDAPLSWAETVREAGLRQQGLSIHGGGSKAFFSGQTLPHGPSSHIDTRSYHGILAYEPSELVITVRSGTRLSEVEAELARQGQHLAFEPPHFGTTATIGGMLATGLSGPARMASGSVRDYVLGLRLINGRGQHLSFGGQVMKNVAGYDISRLMVGSMGQLGIITEVSLKVLPVAVAEATLQFPMGQAEALQQLARWRARPLPLNASCWVCDDTQSPAQELLFVRLRGARAAVDAARQQMLSECLGTDLDPVSTAADWAACREQTLPFFAHPPHTEAALWRLSVPPNTPPLHTGDIPSLIEWHGGLRWIWAPLSQATWIHQLAQAAGGHATLFRPPEEHGTIYPDAPATATALDMIAQRVRHAFDPFAVFQRPTVHLGQS